MLGKHIIVNYHYVEDLRGDFSGIHPCSKKEFERQIEYISNHFKPVSLAELFDRVQKNDPTSLCAITFDDGLKDQYENAIPILKKYKVPAAFFIITSALEGRVPSTHKIHVLLSRFRAEELIDALNVYLKSNHSDLLPEFYVPKDKRLTLKRKLRDDVVTANLKEAANTLPLQVTEDFFTHIFKEKGLDEAKTAKELFMDREDVKDLAQDGFLIGSHTHSHHALDLLEDKNIEEAVVVSKKYLEELLKMPIQLFCYPHGGTSLKSKEIVSHKDFILAVTTEEREVTVGTDPLLIPRFDTNSLRDKLNAQI